MVKLGKAEHANYRFHVWISDYSEAFSKIFETTYNGLGCLQSS